ncbi:MAG: hypothetical protein JXA60_03420 [Candidatus Coatesbacteria bacterium]|nr:hypothetical protein [Candidatus Coatesbacteria bacterium]
MKIFLVICLCFCMLSGEDFFPDKEQTYIDSCLSYLNLNRRDLEFDKLRGYTGLYLLPDVKLMMDKPLTMASFTLNTREVLLKNKNKPVDLLWYNARLLGREKEIKEIIENLRKETRDFKLASLSIDSPSLYFNLSQYVNSLIIVNNNREKALSGLSLQEKKDLYRSSVIFWADEGDKTVKDELKELKIDEPKDSTIIYQKNMWKKVNLDLLIAAGIYLAEETYKFNEKIKEIRIKNNFKQQEIVSPVGKILISGKSDDNIKGDYCLIVDFSGNDNYSLKSTSIEPWTNSLQVIIDLDGNDMYDGKGFSSLGGSLLGYSILIDNSGDDKYIAEENSLGSTVFGLAILHDLNGNDIYRGSYNSQGCATFGIGMLVDEKGNDIYRIDRWGQGFGGTYGAGLLLDSGGNDNYYAGGKTLHLPLRPTQYQSFAQGFGMGLRDHTPGGIGQLWDLSGNDLYYTEIYGQGCSYWYSLGVLGDLDGDDTYNLAQYGQGAGIHLSAGVFYDEKGNDHYFSRWGPGQGDAHDFAVGLMWDRSGDDMHQISGGLGRALTNSVGIFIDSEGNDIYSCYEPISLGTATWARGFGGVGIFLDLDGDDNYPREYKSANNNIWFNGMHAIGLDRKALEKSTPQFKMKELEKADIDSLKDKAKIKRLFEIGSEWQVGDNVDRVDAARKMLTTLGKPMIEYLYTERIKTFDGLELRCLEVIGSEHKGDVLPILIKNIDSDNDTIQFASIYVMGEVADSGTINILLNRMQGFSTRLKSISIITIGKIITNDKGGKLKEIAGPNLIPFLEDKELYIRVNTAMVLGQINYDKAFPELLKRLEDIELPARQAAGSSIKDMAANNLQEVEKFLAGNASKKAKQELLIWLAKLYKETKDKVLAEKLFFIIKTHKGGLIANFIEDIMH